MMPVLQGLNTSDHPFEIISKSDYTVYNDTQDDELPYCNFDTLKFIILGPIGIFVFFLVCCCCLCKVYDVCKYDVCYRCLEAEQEPLLVGQNSSKKGLNTRNTPRIPPLIRQPHGLEKTSGEPFVFV